LQADHQGRPRPLPRKILSLRNPRSLPRKNSSLSKLRLRIRSRCSRNLSSLSKSRILRCLILRLTKTPLGVKVPTLLRGPRPSQRPSRASWQLTNTRHFQLMSRLCARPRPWAEAKAGSIASRNILSSTSTMLRFRFTIYIRPPIRISG